MNRHEIISKSASLVNAEGLGALTSSRLAREFNVKAPSLYKHISGINELYDELGMLAMKELIRLIEHNVFGFSGDDALRELARSFRVYAKKNPGLYQAMHLTHVLRGREYQKIAESLMQLLSRVITAYKIDKTNHVHAIRNLRCLVHGFIDLELRGGFGLKENVDKSFDIAVDGFLLTLKKLYK